jgi:hypothetical protein
MSLNKQQKALLANIENIFNTLVSVKVPQDVLQAQMATWITDFEDKVPEHRLHIVMGDTPRLEVIDCSRDNAKMARDSSQYLTLRARLLNTRLTAIVASRDSTTSNAVVAQSLRELAGLIEKMPFELASKDSVDLFEVLGIKHTAGNQDDDQGVEHTTEGEDAPIVAVAPAVTPTVVEPVAVAESAVVEQASVLTQENKPAEGEEEPLIALVSVSEEEVASL